MIYQAENYAERERAAWQAGDYERAELLGLASELDAALDKVNVLDAIYDRIVEANWRTGKKAELRDLIEQILAYIDATP